MFQPQYNYMKKSSQSIVAFLVGSLLAASVAFAADTKTESKVAKCCANAKADGKSCTHACCVEAAKDGKNCAKCGGSGTMEKKTETKK